MKPRTKKRLLVATMTPLLLASIAEFSLRTLVPACGVTPFRVSQRAGLASEFRPGFRTLYKGFMTSFNSDGYRGAEWPDPRTGALRVALVGDSFVFGSAIDLSDTLAVRLEEALGDAQVLNLGVPGYCAGNVAAVVEHDALGQEAGTVLYVFYNNDIDPPPSFEAIPQDAIIDGMYGFPGHSALLQWLNVRVKRVALRGFGIQLARRTPAQSVDLLEEGGEERVRAAIQDMRDRCGAEGVRFAVAVYPNLTVVDQSPFRPIDLRVIRVCRDLGVECIDLLGAFQGEADLTRYWASVFDTHPNGMANGRVADYLASQLWEG